MFLTSDVGGFDSGGRGPYDDFWYGPVPGKTTSGVRVNDETALRVATVFACVNVISQDIAKIPLVLYRRKADGSRERVTNHRAIRVLDNPTRHLSAIEWRQRHQAHLLLRGNAYAQIRTNWRGEVIELAPLKPENVRVESMPDGSLRYHYMDSIAGTERIFVEGEIMHIRGLSLDGPLGLSPIDQLKETLGEAVSAQQYGASFFANDARPGIILEHPGHFKDESQRKEWLAAFRRAYGAGNRFSPMLTEYGIQVKGLPALSHSDIQFIELRKFKGPEICAIFRVPPHKVGILDRSTNNNIEHQGIEYTVDCLLTWCRKWEEKLAADLLTTAEREEFYFEFLLDALMRGDTKSRFDAYNVGINAGFLTRNEVRRRENLDAIDGLDEPLRPLNMTTEDEAGDEGAGDAGDTQAPQDKGAPIDDAQTARAINLELQARRRVANRETRAIARELEKHGANVGAFADAVTTFYAEHSAFVREALAINRDQAEAYCLARVCAIEAALTAGTVAAMLEDWRARSEAFDFDPLPAAESAPALAQTIQVAKLTRVARQAIESKVVVTLRQGKRKVTPVRNERGIIEHTIEEDIEP